MLEVSKELEKLKIKSKHLKSCFKSGSEKDQKTLKKNLQEFMSDAKRLKNSISRFNESQEKNRLKAEIKELRETGKAFEKKINEQVGLGEILSQHDRSLNDILNTTRMIKMQAFGMNNELVEQNQELDVISKDVETGIEDTETGIGALEKMIGETSETCLYIIMISLIVLLVFLMLW